MSLCLHVHLCTWVVHMEEAQIFTNVQTDICESPRRLPCPALYTHSWNGASRAVIKGPLLTLRGDNCAAGYCSTPPEYRKSPTPPLLISLGWALCCTDAYSHPHPPSSKELFFNIYIQSDKVTMLLFWAVYSTKNLEKNDYGFYKRNIEQLFSTLIILRNISEDWSNYAENSAYRNKLHFTLFSVFLI